MSAAADAFKINLDQYGATVSHQPRTGSAISVKGIFSQAAMTPLKDDREGRSNSDAGSLLVSDTDINGNAVTIDGQGMFTIDGRDWAVTNSAGVDGGFLISVKSPTRQTARHLPGNR